MFTYKAKDGQTISFNDENLRNILEREGLEEVKEEAKEDKKK